jgi:hypothetical protein
MSLASKKLLRRPRKVSERRRPRPVAVAVGLVGLVDVVVEIVVNVLLRADGDSEEGEVVLHGQDRGLDVDLGGVRAVDAHVGNARRAARAEPQKVTWIRLPSHVLEKAMVALSHLAT